VNRVDLLITEDKKLRLKSKKLGLLNRVLSINSFISWATSQNPELIEYKALSVKKVLFGNVNINDEFFDSFRDSYSGFNDWFAKKCDEEAYICQNDIEKILGFLYLKTETESENYSDMEPIFLPKRRLKIGTFNLKYSRY
jgi:hypothetical protein